jgi:hypothetical protein
MEDPAMVIPTSATTAFLAETPMLADTLLSVLGPALLFAAIYCAWDMLLSSLVGRRPSRSRWTMLLTAAALVVTAILADSFLTVAFRFNGDGETSWGYILSPWLLLAFIPCAAVLVVFRFLDARKAASFGGIPAAVWWIAGCLVVSAYGVSSTWASWGSIMGAAYVTPILAFGFVLGMVAVGSLAVAAALRWTRRAASLQRARA